MVKTCKHTCIERLFISTSRVFLHPGSRGPVVSHLPCEWGSVIKVSHIRATPCCASTILGAF